MPGMKQRHSAATNAKVRGHPPGILGVRKQHNNFRSQPIGVATEELGSHIAFDHNSWAILFSGLFLWKINLREEIQLWGKNFSKLCWENPAAPWDQPFAHGAGLVRFGFSVCYGETEKVAWTSLCLYLNLASLLSPAQKMKIKGSLFFFLMFFFRPHPSYHFPNFTHSLKQELMQKTNQALQVRTYSNFIQKCFF